MRLLAAARFRPRRTMIASGVLLLPLVAVLGTAQPAAAVPVLPSGFRDTVVFAGLNEPTGVEFAADGRVFVAEKRGVIQVFDSLTDTTPTVFADLQTETYNFWDRGLLGLALHPDFPATPSVYALYTRDAPVGGSAPRWGEAGAIGDPCPTPPGPTDSGCVVSGRLVKLTAGGNTATASQTLIDDWCQQFPSHSIGTLAFGPDGALYAGAGDGASFNFADYGQTPAAGPTQANPCADPPSPAGTRLTAPAAEGGALRSQDLRTPADPTTLDGSIIRINPDTGAALPSNPLAGSADANARRIVATGMRNPFRFTFRPGTSEIWAGDVGWGSWEEINRIQNPTAAVTNLGWPCYEGDERQGGYDAANLTVCENLYAAGTAARTDPYYAYHHGAPLFPGDACPTNAGSVTSGLAFAAPGNYPARYQGALFFADHSHRCIWAMLPGSNGLPDPARVEAFATGAENPVELQTGPGGDLFYVNLDGGQLRRISYQATNTVPTAVATASPTSGSAPLAVQFDGTGSFDPDPGDTLTYAWDLDGDGQYDDSTAARPMRTYTAAGQVVAGLRVTDSRTGTDTTTVTISVNNNAPTATIDTPTTALRWKVGDAISFAGGATDPEEGALPASALSWQLIQHHCTTAGCHTHNVTSFPGAAGGSFFAPDHEYPSHLELRLTARDAQGLASTASVALEPRTVDLTFTTTPAGLELGAFSEQLTAPFTRTVIVGSSNSVAAPSPQLLAGRTQEFSSWSDGGAAAHNITAPATPTTYTAVFREVAEPSGLVAAYSFDEGGGSTAADASGLGNTGTLTGTSWSTAGRFGRALSFDGTSSWVTVPDSPSLRLSTGMTLAAWVRPTATTGWRTVLLKEMSPGLSYALYGSDDGGRPSAYLDTGAGEQGAASPAGLAANAWSHLAASYDGTTLRLYVNGTQVASRAQAGPISTTGGVLRIGGNSVWGEYFAGLVDEVRVYNRALTAAQIGTDMTTPVVADTQPPSKPAGLAATGGLGQVTLAWTASTDNAAVSGYRVHRSTSAGFTPSAANRVAVVSGTGYADTGLAPGTYHYRVVAFDAAGNDSPGSDEATGAAGADTTAPTVSVTAPAAGATLSGSVTLTATAADNGTVAGVQFRVDGVPLGAEDTAAPYAVPWNTTAASNGSHTVTAVARDGAGLTATSAPVTVTVSNTADTGLMAEYGFNEGSGTAAADSSGRGNHGTAAGTTWSAAGRFGAALSFNGTSSWVTVPHSASLALTGGMTVEAWVRPGTLSSWRTAVLKERGGGLSYGLYASNGSRPAGYLATGGGDREVAGGSALAADSWSHVALTYDGATMRLYVNGTQAGSRAQTGDITAGTGPLRIGGNSVWGEYFAGLVDEVRVYNRALTAAQVGADMTRPV